MKAEIVKHRESVLEREYCLLEQARESLAGKSRVCRLGDIGCGPFGLLGVKGKRLSELQAGSVGVDLDLATLKRNANVTHRVCASCYSLPFATASLDFVVCRWVFEHLENPEMAMREFSRVLKPGGFLYIKTPNLWNYGMMLSRVTPTAFHNAFRCAAGLRENSRTFYRANTKHKLGKLASKTAFAVHAVEFHSNSYNYYGFNKYLFLLMRSLSRLMARVTDRAQQILLCVMRNVGTDQSASPSQAPRHSENEALREAGVS
ncbi:MAG: class I SAM-dependent methyltransferase [Terriglobia bacterium]